MINLKCMPIAVAILAITTSAAFAAGTEDHEKHHPAESASATAAPVDSGMKGGEGMGMMNMSMMKDHMKKMREHMKGSENAKTPADQNKMMGEQMDMMMDHMDMMMRMMDKKGGRGMKSGDGSSN